jgi:hypothetical protein
MPEITQRLPAHPSLRVVDRAWALLANILNISNKNSSTCPHYHFRLQLQFAHLNVICKHKNVVTIFWRGARGSVVGWGTVLQAGRSRVRFPMPLKFFNWPNPSSRTMALGPTQPLTEMSTRNLPGGKGRPARIRLTSPPSVSRLSRENVVASTHHNPMDLHDCYTDSFIFLTLFRDVCSYRNQLLMQQTITMSWKRFLH